MNTKRLSLLAIVLAIPVCAMAQTATPCLEALARFTAPNVPAMGAG